MKKNYFVFIVVLFLFVLVSCGKEKYEIKWVVEGVTVETDSEVEEDTVPDFNGNTPIKGETVSSTFTFSGWSPSISKATKDQTYVAQFTEVKKKYTITFESNGGSSVDSITREYGELVEMPTNPTYDGHRFIAWCSDQELTTPVTWPITLTENVTIYASWNEQVDIKAFLNSLLESYELNPYSYIPEPMRYSYAPNLIESTDGEYDYSTFVEKEDILFGGFGEQWHMVLDNINQSQSLFNALSVIETISSSVTVTFNNYFDANPSDTANHTFMEGEYKVTIKYEDNVISLTLDYTADFPIFGEQTAQIYLDYDVDSLEKECRIQIGDANVLKYEISENSYRFAIRYLGIRRAYFEVERDQDDNVDGSIFEFTGLDGSISVSSAAQFHIANDYVSVVGNKAGGLIGFTGYINELYNATTGKLLSYEVREELSTIVYNTLWFNLSDIDGITNIKEETIDNVTSIYVNNLDDPFEVKLVGGFNLKAASRRYDIEFRTQYYYYYDSVNDAYVEVASKVPMLFVQEEQLESFKDDVNSKNPLLNLNISLDSEALTKVQADYDTMIDVFIVNKENIKAETILEYIGEKK